MTDEDITERLLDRFDQQWRTTSPPQISEFVAEATEQGCGGAKFLSELVKIDLEYRYRWPERKIAGPDGKGSTAPLPKLEDYAAALPELELSADLLVEECRVRSRFSVPPDFAELQARFPQLVEQAKETLQSLSGLVATSASMPPTPRTDCTTATLDRDDAPLIAAGEAADGDAANRLQPQSIGRYRVLEVLGKGSFGVVWKAHDPKLLRDVAIKSVAFEMIGSPQRRSMLLEEARNAASLQHPGLVTVFDVLEKHGQIHLVMELVDGRPLHRWVKGRRPELARIVRLLADVAAAVHAAHQSGLVHCDLKPANILVDGHEEIRVTDFGLSVRPVNLRGQSMQVFGTPAYMSPEQVRGEVDWIDARTDIWALGVVLYQMIHDRLPFGQNDPHNVFDEILDEPPALADDEPAAWSGGDLGDAVRRIYLRCLAKLPPDRFSSAEELAGQLYALVGTSGHPSAAVVPARRSLPNSPEIPVGRDSVIRQLTQALGEQNERLVTVIGPGGVGKTRVALEACQQLDLAGGRAVYWVDLASVDEPRGLAMAVLAALGVSTEGLSGDPTETVAETLAFRGRLLLALDNVEQIAEVVATAVHGWLQRAPDVGCLVTSQTPLGMSLERRVSLAPLAFPSGASLEPSRLSLAQARRDFPAIDLFVRRAEKAGTTLADDAETIEYLSSICRQLDGLPLALELAAARTSMLSLPSIHQRVLRSTEFLRSRHHDTPDRHRTLHAAIGWGLEGLSEQGKIAIFSLSQLPTGCRVGLAERLLENLLEGSPADPLELLEELEGRSLLMRDRSDPRRIALLRTVREFARCWGTKTIPAWARTSWRKRAADTFTEAAQTSEADLRLQPADGLNVWAAAEWAAEIEEPRQASQLALIANDLSTDQMEAQQRAERLEPFARMVSEWSPQLVAARAEALLLAGETQAAVTACQRALQRGVSQPQEANLRRVYGTALVDHGERNRGLEQLDRGLAVAEAHEDWRTAVQILSKLAHSAWRGGDATRALRLLDRAESYRWEADDRRDRIDVLRLRGGIDLLQGRPGTAHSQLQEAEKLARDLDDHRILRDVLQSLAAVTAELGRFDEALQHSDRAERLSRSLGDRRGIARALNNRALFLIDQGAPEAALAILEDAEKLYRQIGQPDGLAICYTTAGSALLADGRYAEADARLDRALKQLGALSGSIHHAVILGDQAAAQLRLGNRAAALAGLGEVFKILDQCGAAESPEAFIYRVLHAEILLESQHAEAPQAVALAKRLQTKLELDASHPRLRLRQAVGQLDEWVAPT